MNKTPILTCEKVSKIYEDGKAHTPVLHDIDFHVYRGETHAITGPSGSGKSTLMHLLGGLDTPTHGTIAMNGHTWESQSEKRKCDLRNQHLGFIYQFHHLLPELTALENTMLPLLLNAHDVRTASKKATAILEEVQLGHRLDHKPAQLSGGERQRVAIARALITNPDCILADEPTGNLDNQTAAHVFELLCRLNQQYQTTLIMVTHDLALAKHMQQVWSMQGGRISPAHKE
jgi:lipoprotein-releasing system ATP-binding protein